MLKISFVLSLSKYCILFFLLSFLVTKSALAQTNASKYYKAKVLEVVSTSEIQTDNKTLYNQKLNLELLDGDLKGKYITINYGDVLPIKKTDLVKSDDQVVLEVTTDENGNKSFNIDQKYRLNGVLYIVIIFIALAVLFAGLKGITSILGLILSFVIIVTFILPNILAGQNPILISLFGSFLIALFSIYLAHGINIRTSISLISTLLTLLLTIGLSFLMVYLTKLTGAGSEEALFLQFGYNKEINLQGLLLGGIIIGTLGVLDDITTAQVAAVNEIHKANESLKFWDLYKRGTNIGKEHIASLINTLVLAYTGASLPLVLLFNVNKDIPLWVTLNSEFIVEEIVRTLVGSSGLILAVPISTILAAYVFGVRKIKSKSSGHIHVH